MSKYFIFKYSNGIYIEHSGWWNSLELCKSSLESAEECWPDEIFAIMCLVEE